jgi:ribonuclease P protein component
MPAVRFRFPKSSRLFRASEFRRMKAEGVSFHGKFIVLSVLKDMPAPEVRVGLITSRRVGAAVVRNRVRRRLREIVRVARPQIREGTWLTLIARQAAAGASSQTLAEEWQQLARRSSILTA